NLSSCALGDHDWGDDSLTYALSLRAQTIHDLSLEPLLDALAATAPSYRQPCTQAANCRVWSDSAAWDAVALADEYQATQDPSALPKAQAALVYVVDGRVFNFGACPSIPYQIPGGGHDRLKTLETEANALKAALLLY